MARMINKFAEFKPALGLTVLMAEQNFQQAIRIADRGYVLVHSKIAISTHDPNELLRSYVVRQIHLDIDGS
jgi:branched-chain amino acid transport system ATP-binding protein